MHISATENIAHATNRVRDAQDTVDTRGRGAGRRGERHAAAGVSALRWVEHAHGLQACRAAAKNNEGEEGGIRVGTPFIHEHCERSARAARAGQRGPLLPLSGSCIIGTTALCPRGLM